MQKLYIMRRFHWIQNIEYEIAMNEKERKELLAAGFVTIDCKILE